MTDTTPGAPAPIPDPRTSEGVLLAVGRSFVDVQPRYGGTPIFVIRRRDPATGTWQPAAGAWQPAAGAWQPGNWDDQDAILLHLIDRVRAAEARVAELEAALPRALNGDVIMPGSFLVRRYGPPCRAFTGERALLGDGVVMIEWWNGQLQNAHLSTILSAHPNRAEADAAVARLNAARKAEENQHD